MRNKYPGRCDQCGVWVPAEAGSYVGGRVLCAQHSPVVVQQAPSEPIIVMDLRGDRQAFVKAEGYLGDRFGAFRDATTASGCKFEYSTKGNVCSLEAASRLILELQRSGLRVDVRPKLVEALTGRVAQVQTELQIAGVRIEAVEIVLAARGLSLFAYQREGVQWLSPRIGALLADSMGVGKTIQAITSLPNNAPVVVICPAVVKGVWVNEIAKWRPDLKTTMLEGRKSFRWPSAGEVVIINYDILPAAPNPKKQIKGDDVAKPPPGCVIVGDEIHYAKSSKAARTLAFRRLSAMVQANAGRTWLLTGTPLVNRPIELWTVLQCANIASEAFGGFNNYKRLFNATETGYQGALEWGDPEPEVPDLLKRVMLRRTKSDVLKDLPEKIYQTVPVEIDAKYAREVEKTLKAQGLTVQEVVEAIETSMAETGKIPFERFSAVREVLARAKYDALLDWLAPYEEACEPVLVFSAHLWPVQTLVEQKLAEGKRWGLITGSDTKAADRTRIVEEFQAGKLDGIAMTIKAGGVGITLTRAKTAVYVDSSWTPAENEQSEDRLHRIGQTRGTTIVNLVANHPMDERVHELLSIKRELIDATIEAARTRPGEAVRTSTGDIEAGLAAIGTRGVRVQSGPVPGAPVVQTQIERPAVPPEPAPPQRKVYRPAKNATEEWAVRGLETLIELDPDRAQEKNEMGFNASDGEFGRVLYGTLQQSGGLTDRQWEVTVKMLRKYHGQIGRAPDYIAPEKAAKKPRARKPKLEDQPET